ncbi:unnamed protein product [Blumeria hordei]|uniref:Candidate secreted effector protein n=2 Tax=Blumeria hordei TaxID=2867405 RepID=A0A383V169_BLUHO|nr:CSEP0096 putative effector protein [Blumeria hordei DH14]SZF05739.1 unnamed protein product [Blumeria hordei]
MMHLFMTGVFLKVIFVIVHLSTLSEGRGFQCSAGVIVDQDLESIRQLACNSLQTGNRKSSVDNNSQGNEEVGYEWKLPKPLALEQVNGGMITQLQLTEKCEITSITVSSKENESQVCPKEMAIRKRQNGTVICQGVLFRSQGLIDSAARYCSYGRVRRDDVLGFPPDYTPAVFSTVNHYMAEVPYYDKVNDYDYDKLTYVVFDESCRIVGAMVFADYKFRSCEFEYRG